MKFIYIIVLSIILGHVNINSQEKIKYPETKKVDVVDNYFGTKVADPYRWMEDMDSPDVKKWIEEENKITFGYLDKIPFREKIRARLTEVWNYPKYSRPFKAGNYYFFFKNNGLQNQYVLYIQKDLDSEPEVFLDPNTFSEDGTVALLNVNASNDGKYLSYSVSKSGSDWREINVIEIESRKVLSDHITNVKFSDANWFKDGFFYDYYDAPKDVNLLSHKNEFQKVYYHKLGTDQSQDVLMFEDKTNPKLSSDIWSSEDEKYLFKYAGETGQEGNKLYFKPSDNIDKEWIPIIEEYGFSTWPVQNEGSKIFLNTNKNAPKYKLVMLNADDISSGWKDILPEKDITLDGVKYIGGKIIATYMVDVTSRVYTYDINGNFISEVTLPGIGTVNGFDGRKEDKQVFYTFTSFVYPGSVYIYDVETGISKLFRKSEVKFKSDEYEEKEVFYSSKDGTKVPMFLVHKKGLVLDGNNPVYLYSYGGFNVTMNPGFSISRLPLLEYGGVFAMPCIRGGGEYGEEWHKAAMLFNKQNAFDDFIAAAEYLIKEGYTSPQKIAIAGGSNGGLLIGAVVNQRPELFKVAIPAVGVMDMLRFQKFTIGAAWTREYGSSEDNEEIFKYLYSYSPIHNIKEGINYPATMVTTADHDDRVVPLHSFKYTAALQERYKGNNPVLIRVETKAGHGSGKPTSKWIEEITDEWSFVFYNLGVVPN
ncbi:MAG: S9 family peptidase [Ignavibacteriae bacterium]|nr:MAG: S9 family peptidase [Ignavibacteriota bacterium]